jgi:hypothetical protein
MANAKKPKTKIAPYHNTQRDLSEKVGLREYYLKCINDLKDTITDEDFNTDELHPDSVINVKTIISLYGAKYFNKLWNGLSMESEWDWENEEQAYTELSDLIDELHTDILFWNEIGMNSTDYEEITENLTHYQIAFACGFMLSPFLVFAFNLDTKVTDNFWDWYGENK